MLARQAPTISKRLEIMMLNNFPSANKKTVSLNSRTVGSESL